ncbi:hypothetical protein KDK_04370 [Dictyobacter kobayashii]|uniref:Uncharacterized protein n=1 Tax=Dictyobacter kobayashii TaxID=2014872 RepID=A0A402AC10_9CHLR|nr:hypothetical protein KDK_04370 [Dictyobacter kobayashii]
MGLHPLARFQPAKCQPPLQSTHNYLALLYNSCMVEINCILLIPLMSITKEGWITNPTLTDEYVGTTFKGDKDI